MKKRTDTSLQRAVIACESLRPAFHAGLPPLSALSRFEWVATSNFGSHGADTKKNSPRRARRTRRMEFDEPANRVIDSQLKCTGDWAQDCRSRPMRSAFDPFVLFASFVVKQFCTFARECFCAFSSLNFVRSLNSSAFRLPRSAFSPRGKLFSLAVLPGKGRNGQKGDAGMPQSRGNSSFCSNCSSSSMLVKIPALA